jgi:hypothetical protein
MNSGDGYLLRKENTKKRRWGKYTEKQFVDAVKNSNSIRQLLIALNVSSYGGNYRSIKKLIEEFNLDTSHFTGQAHSKGKTVGPKRPIEDYLSNKQGINSHKLRKRLIKEGIFEAKCHNCNLTEWLGQPISLELEHIDGNHSNNNLSNLTIICPNCHAQTGTYRRNKASLKV